jgi:hypothetical protein
MKEKSTRVVSLWCSVCRFYSQTVVRKNLFILRSISVSLLVMVFMSIGWAQRTIPFSIRNNSTFSDHELFVAIVGKDYTTGRHIWINPRTSEILPMDAVYNTVAGPMPGGNTGPGQNGKYANCFVKLSDMQNKTFQLPPMEGCRVFISKGQQLYLYFFGSSGDPSGYAAPNHLNTTDPNKGILYEIIELTNNQYGFFGNPSRVDVYQYPMGMELFGDNGYHQKVGELKKHEEIVALYKANVPVEFQGSVTPTGEIWAPSKTSAFADGADGRAVGAQVNYFKSYIDAIWTKYSTEDLIFFAGDAGVFKGRVQADGRLVVVGQSGGFTGRMGIVPGKPSTQEALEGKGVLDRRVQPGKEGDVDLVVQAQLCAAINRHMVDITSRNPGEQHWYTKSQFYQQNPMNHYAKFWHLPGVSVNELAYGFCYDDVADHSPSLHTPHPTKVIAIFGGFAGIDTTSPPPDTTGPVTVYKHCDFGGYAVSLPTGDFTLDQLKAKGALNDDLSSIKVDKGYQVQLFEHADFTGETFILTANSTCLGKWNDRISSIKISMISTVFSKRIEAEAYNAMLGIENELTQDPLGGEQNVGWIDAGDWMAYNKISIPSSGSYLVEYRVASPNGGALSLDLNAGSVQLGGLNVPATGDWQKWTTISHIVYINEGTYNIGIFAQQGGWNLNWWRISKSGTSTTLQEPGLITSGFPSPFEGNAKISVKLNEAGHTKISVYNGSSKVTDLHNGYLEAGVHEFDFYAENLPAGLYLYTITQHGNVQTERILKK